RTVPVPRRARPEILGLDREDGARTHRDMVDIATLHRNVVDERPRGALPFEQIAGERLTPGPNGGRARRDRDGGKGGPQGTREQRSRNDSLQYGVDRQKQRRDTCAGQHEETYEERAPSTTDRLHAL